MPATGVKVFSAAPTRAKGASLALVGFRESRILTAWARRGGLVLNWRSVPTRDEIREARALRLGNRVSTSESSSSLLGLAQKLLREKEPESLVATLLSMIETEAHQGFDIPEPFRGEPVEPRRTYARQGSKPGCKRPRADDRPNARYGSPRPFKRSGTRPGR